MSNVLLSICVPSFNQRDALKVTLESLKHLSSDFMGRVEIIVSDNGSKDDSILVSEQSMADIRVDTQLLKREELSPGTFCDNLNKLLQNAVGSYIWFVGCGEYILASRLNEILHVLEMHNPSNLVLSSRIYSNEFELTEILDKVKLERTNVGVDTVGKVTGGNHEVFFDHSVSCNVIRREVLLFGGLLDLRTENRWPHVESMFKFMYLYDFYALKFAPIAILVHQPSSGWYSSKQNWSIYLELCNVYFRYSNKLLEINSPWGPTVLDLAKNMVSKRSMWLIFLFRELGDFPKIKDFIGLCRLYWLSSKFNLVLFVLVLISPKFAVKIARRILQS